MTSHFSEPNDVKTQQLRNMTLNQRSEKVKIRTCKPFCSISFWSGAVALQNV